MKPLRLDDILDLDLYEQIRPDYRARVIAHKESRRIGLGDRVTLVFEDRETVRYQIQEMARVERLRGPEKIQGELDAYNDLVPGEGELSATLFIEIPELDQIRAELDRLIGLDEHVRLVLGEGTGEHAVPAEFDPKQMEEERLSAVQYIRFRLSAPLVEGFAAGWPARLQVDHPAYAAESWISEAMRASLLRDLRGEPVELMDAAWRAPGAVARDAVLSEHDGIRVLRPAHPVADDHCVVELSAPGGSLFELDPGRWQALLGVLREAARPIVERSGGCRISTELTAEPARSMRWHLVGRRP